MDTSKYVFFGVCILIPMSLVGCLGPKDNLSQICKIPAQSPTTAKFSISDCSTRTALCPINTSFCKKTYPRDLGFWYHCAPENLGATCENASCSESEQIPVSNFSQSLICEAMALSQLVYKPNSAIKSALANKKNLEIHNSTLAAISYVFYEDDNYQRIGIQGSESACEWSLDLDSSLTSEPTLYGMKLHKGFSDVAKEIHQIAMKSIPSSTSKPIIITGHSLGGALSVLLGMLLSNNGYKIDSVITFGQPQVTDSAGIQLFNKHFANQFKLLRVINQNDIIPYFLWILDNSYMQFGSEMRIEQTPDQKLTFALLETPDGTPWAGEFDFSKVSDHLIASYQQSISTLFAPLGTPCQGYQSGQL